MFKTTDGGKHWRQVDPLHVDDTEIRFSAVAYASSNPKIVYADSGGLFLRSEDGGENWQVFNVGPDSGASAGENRGQPIALVVHPKDPNRLYMNAYDGGVFISNDGGRTWQDASRGTAAPRPGQLPSALWTPPQRRRPLKMAFTSARMAA